MKIACLQFAPQVGDIDNNLNRADAVLNRAKHEDLEGLDLLVLPELAFSGKLSVLFRDQLSPWLASPPVEL
jgi:protein N-terminal amidase